MTLTRFRTTAALVLLVLADSMGAGWLICETSTAQSIHAPKEPAMSPLPRQVPRQKKDQDLLQGTWKVVEAEANGKHLPKEVSKAQQWTFAGTQITIHYKDDGSKDVLTFRLDPKTTPKALAVTAVAGLRKGYKPVGIYQLDKDQLKICLTWAQGAPRPDRFNAFGNTHQFEDRGRRFFILKREQPPADKDGTLQQVLNKYRSFRPEARDLAIFQLDWVATLKQARDRAAREKRPIFLMVVTNSYGNLYTGHC
jgi:uncharacterized protein (TIGR03067 family)